MKKTVNHKEFTIDIDFKKNEINVSVWKKDKFVEGGYSYIGEHNFKIKK